MSIFSNNSIHPDYINNQSDQQKLTNINKLKQQLKSGIIIGYILLFIMILVNIVMLSVPDKSPYIPNDSLQTVIAYDPNEYNNICFSENGVSDKNLIEICKKYFSKNSNYSFYIVITKQNLNYILASTTDIDLTSETLDFVKDFKLDNPDNIFVKSDLSNTFLSQKKIELDNIKSKSDNKFLSIDIVSKVKSDEINRNIKIVIVGTTIFMTLFYLWCMWIFKKAIKKLENINK